MKYSITLLDDQRAMVPQGADLSWDQLVKLFSEFQEGDFDKTKKAHFNGCKFKAGTRRLQDNVEALHILVLDFDDGMSIEKAKEHFKQYRHIGYTSYNHQYDKHGDGVVVDKFRILLPLLKPCPLTDWKEIRHNVKDFAPGVDMSCVRLHQPFTVPLKRPNVDGEIWTNDGDELDWSDWNRTPLTDLGYTSANPNLRSEHKLHPDDILRTRSGNIRVGDVIGVVSGVYCPFHNDKAPGEFIRKNESGTFLSCHKCNTIWMENNEEDYIETFLRQQEENRKKKSYKQRMIEKFANEKEAKQTVSDDPLSYIPTPEALLEFDQTLCEPKTRDQRAAMLNKKYRSTEQRILLYAAEGFGKSYLTVMLARRGEKILFTCKSNLQVFEQGEGFECVHLNDGGEQLRVQTICSRDYWLRTNHNVEIEYYEQKHPWDAETVNDKKTMKNMSKMGMPDEEIDRLWELYEPPGKPDFENYEIVVTTQARTMAWGRIQESKRQYPHGLGGEDARSTIPDKDRQFDKDVIVVCDDAQLEDFCMLADYDPKFAKSLVFKKPIKRKEIDDYIYFVRPRMLLFGHGFEDNQIIFSTTEMVTRDLILKQYGGEKKPKGDGKVYVPDLMADGKLIAGKISMIKTECVRAKSDGILPVLFERVRRDWPNKIEYIADGQGCLYNHVTIKGQNIFKEHDMIIEISHSHYLRVRRLLHEVGLDEDNRRMLQVALALDAIHQAVGRNSGYRYSDIERSEDRRESVVLIEPMLFKDVLEHMRYQYTRAIDLDDSRTRFKPELVGAELAATIGWLIQNQVEYVRKYKSEQFMADVNKAFSRGGIGNRGPVKRKRRLLDAMGNLLVVIQRKIDFIKKPEDFKPRIDTLKSDIHCITGLIEIIEEIDVTRMLQGSPTAESHTEAVVH